VARKVGDIGASAKLGTLEFHNMNDLIRTFTERGDLAHLALFLWAAATSAAFLFTLRELAAASKRFDDFVRELSLFNRRIRRRKPMD
jgi:hypothetical protein